MPRRKSCLFMNQVSFFGELSARGSHEVPNKIKKSAREVSYERAYLTMLQIQESLAPIHENENDMKMILIRVLRLGRIKPLLTAASVKSRAYYQRRKISTKYETLQRFSGIPISSYLPCDNVIGISEKDAELSPKYSTSIYHRTPVGNCSRDSTSCHMASHDTFCGATVQLAENISKLCIRAR